MADETPQGEPRTSEQRDAQVRKQIAENAVALTEAAETIKTATEKIEQAAKDLAKFGEIPFGDLERKP